MMNIHALKSAKRPTGFCFVGVLAYADDFVLLAPSPKATRNMLKICDEFCERYSVIFNAISPNVYCVYLLIGLDHAACLMPQLVAICYSL